MLEFYRRRKLRKELKEYYGAARHARNMREDIADPRDLEALARAEEAVREIFRTRKGDMEKAQETFASAIDRVYPMLNRTGLRENVEVIIVAIAAAMAIRAFFFQPFKIPTGSMQPTLNGIITEAYGDPTFMDRQPFKFAKWLATGASYKEVRAKASGRIIPYTLADGRSSIIEMASIDKVKINIEGVEQRFPMYMVDLLKVESDYVEKGDVLARGKVIAGDHILVNKMKYNFTSPDRGDIAVFDTRLLKGVKEDTFYIKRMVGLPNESIQIRNKRIFADGEMVTEPPMFETIATSPLYAGHSNLGEFSNPNHVLRLGDDEYLMLGDNTNNSTDGRYFGPVKRAYFQGPAMFVYWPFREHFGPVH